MKQFDPKTLKQLYRPGKDSHKGENGKLLIIGGSELFHSASMWALEAASRIVDIVFYSSVAVNEQIIRKQKERFQNGIIVPQGKLDEYVAEADCILIGPGMERTKETADKTNYLLKKFKGKKWVIDGGALQMMDKKLLNKNMIITPHHQEYKLLFGQEKIETAAQKYGCTIVLKGREDVICDANKCLINRTGNEGMTKGGTGDVLAGLIAALYCKNKAFLAASCGIYLNGLAGDRLYVLVGPYFNASDLVKEIPRVMGEML
ncbi:MAG: NAD(P)H-hydrate dehydratase [Candidatus Beckwithbacteria bacterium]